MSDNNLLDFFWSFIGDDKKFKSKLEMANYLEVPKTQLSKLYDFLKGRDTQYKIILQWYNKLLELIEFPENNVNTLDGKTTNALAIKQDRINELEKQITRLEAKIEAKNETIQQILEIKENKQFVLTDNEKEKNIATIN